MYTCETCNLTFSNRWNLSRHLKTLTHNNFLNKKKPLISDIALHKLIYNKWVSVKSLHATSEEDKNNCRESFPYKDIERKSGPLIIHKAPMCNYIAIHKIDYFMVWKWATKNFYMLGMGYDGEKFTLDDKPINLSDKDFVIEALSALCKIHIKAENELITIESSYLLDVKNKVTQRYGNNPPDVLNFRYLSEGDLRFFQNAIIDKPYPQLQNNIRKKLRKSIEKCRDKLNITHDRNISLFLSYMKIKLGQKKIAKSYRETLRTSIFFEENYVFPESREDDNGFYIASMKDIKDVMKNVKGVKGYPKELSESYAFYCICKIMAIKIRFLNDFFYRRKDIDGITTKLIYMKHDSMGPKSMSSKFINYINFS